MDRADQTRLGPADKGIPERAFGLTAEEFLTTEPRLADFWTPLIVLDDAAMRHNVDTMARWVDERGLELMPHGKTTMAPALWRRQLEAGSTGITLATMGHVRTGRSLGLTSIMLANSALDQRALRWLVGELADPDFRFVCWADCLDTVAVLDRTLSELAPPRPLEVCVELGVPGRRAGARSVADGIAIAERIAASPVLRLAGVAGYEGVIDSHRNTETVAAVRTFLERQIELHRAIEHLYDDAPALVTAGGSGFFDVVAEVYAAAGAGQGAARFVLRSGAYVTHDDGIYRQLSPFGETAGQDGPRFQAAMRGIGRVISSTEPGLVLLDGGKRDFPYDEGLPIPRQLADDLGAPWRPLEASISELNDQHAFLTTDLPVGSVVELGLSHPCTAFDKWRVLPVVDSWESGRVVELVRTHF
ncbi:hypothetical protein CGZ93_01145 [Enemella dayhoffiae]|uniref:D-serine dehydratase-like domain-containing protein n=1 Tax=Enemella dayhoffiae TaxID=2016507 RepID=A0A255HCS4_9ACTN|nr:alanine racemase [Enemella dayhoffiae]OYO25096.1 hypothetical protein CGZ93_01145 [Enemella dayhoffiae]